MKNLTPEQSTILDMSARKDVSFSDAELKYLKDNINAVKQLEAEGFIEVGYEGRSLRYVLILEKGRDVLYEKEKAQGFPGNRVRE